MQNQVIYYLTMYLCDRATKLFLKNRKGNPIKSEQRCPGWGWGREEVSPGEQPPSEAAGEGTTALRCIYSYHHSLPYTENVM